MENALTQTEIDTIRALRERGFAVVIFTPSELRGADIEAVEDRLIELANDYVISGLSSDDEGDAGDDVRAMVEQGRAEWNGPAVRADAQDDTGA